MYIVNSWATTKKSFKKISFVSPANVETTVPQNLTSGIPTGESLKTMQVPEPLRILISTKV